jgi:protein-tyrosine phosphatase
MTEVLDWGRAADPEGVARCAVKMLRCGQLVLLPSETGYLVGVSGARPDAVGRLRGLLPEEPLELAATGLAGARDWLPDLGPAGRRLARRFWPGPLTLASAEGIDGGLARRLPEAVRRAVRNEGRLHLRPCGHEAVREAADRLGAPLVCGSVLGFDGETLPLRQALERVGEQVDLVIEGPTRYRRRATTVEVNGGEWGVRREGVVPADLVREQMACWIVFVCTGNTCRSPMAEALCKKRLADRLGCTPDELPARGFSILSAGLGAAPGMPAAEEAAAVAGALGIDLSRHQSRSLTPELAGQADHLLAMTAGHLRAMRDYFSAPARLLSPHGDDVDDPVGQPLEVYQACARQMAAYIDALVEGLAPAP